MKLLLIWEEVPEKTSCYALDPSSDIADLARQSAGKFVNLTDGDNDAVNELNELMYDADGNNLFAEYQLDEDKPMIGPFSEVVVCGFML